MFEIEHRAVLTEAEHSALEAALTSRAQLLGTDDKKVGYYIFPDKLLKVVHNISRGDAKLSLKLTALGEGSAFKELEVPFAEGSIETMKEICDLITCPQQVIWGTQKRTNYELEGVEIALKWSEDWGHHVEFEIVVPDLAEKDAADERIKDVAQSLAVTLMTEEEVAAFSAKARAARK